ncbi:MAG: PHP domain-containing protein [Alphaproteobacteria bacterium]|nr:PHP domain-containing protein [Alphaproteobacteria bacterium]
MEKKNTVDYSLHTHTIGFDGRNSVADMVAAADARGMKTFGISNHFIVHPHIKKSKMYEYAVRGGYSGIYSDNIENSVEKFARHYDEVRALRRKYPDMNILCGMEMDWFKYDGWRDVVNYAVRRLHPDYVIGAMHFIDMGEDGVLNIHDIKQATPTETRKLLREYYQNLMQLAEFDWRDMEFQFNWIAHFDLPQKVGLSDTNMEIAALRALKLNSVPLELNTRLINNINYTLKPEILAELSGATAILSDDAHDAVRIGANFDSVLDTMHGAGVKNICVSADNLSKFVNIRSR